MAIKGQQVPGANGAGDEDEDEDDGTSPGGLDLVTVVMGPKGRGRIFYEWHAQHPNDSVAHVVDGWRVRVALTPAVREALGNGLLKQSRLDPTPLPPSVADIIDQRGLLAPDPAPAAKAISAPAPTAQGGNTVSQDAPAASALRPAPAPSSGSGKPAAGSK